MGTHRGDRHGRRHDRGARFFTWSAATDPRRVDAGAGVTTVDVYDNGFGPSVIEVSTGTEVTFDFVDDDVHDVSFDDGVESPQMARPACSNDDSTSRASTTSSARSIPCRCVEECWSPMGDRGGNFPHATRRDRMIRIAARIRGGTRGQEKAGLEHEDTSPSAMDRAHHDYRRTGNADPRRIRFWHER